MSLEITSTPDHEAELWIIENTRSYNREFTPKDVLPLCIFDRSEDGVIIGGLTGKTYWNYLDIEYLWVHEEHRNEGRGTAIVSAAEEEAIRRGCSYVLLDTYSFQALGFYRKLGYGEFGKISDFAGKHSRHYLHKHIS